MIDLPLFLDEISGALHHQLPLEPAAKELALFKVRTIISELLTNTIKHTDQKDSLLELTISGNQLHIVRLDKCSPLQFSATDTRPALIWPLPPEHCHIKHIVYADDLNTLFVEAELQGVAHFTTWQNPSDLFNVNTLQEHFGLLMVTLSADTFTYRYDHQTRENIFTAIIVF